MAPRLCGTACLGTASQRIMPQISLPQTVGTDVLWSSGLTRLGTWPLKAATRASPSAQSARNWLCPISAPIECHRRYCEWTSARRLASSVTCPLKTSFKVDRRSDSGALPDYQTPDTALSPNTVWYRDCIQLCDTLMYLDICLWYEWLVFLKSVKESLVGFLTVPLR